MLLIDKRGIMMFRNYEEAVQYVLAKRKSGIRFDLKRMEHLMIAFKHPERKVKTVHVAGTNGKGSTVTFLRYILQEAEYVVGTFMTPVYDDIEKQIRINGEPMSKEDFVETLSEMKEKIDEVEQELGETISEFELMTALALYYFAYKNYVHIAIFEAGMGGRNDATNVVIPILSIITNVTMDHQAYLGDTLEKIAKEKAGIIKSGVAVVTGASGISLKHIEEEAKEKKASVYAADQYFQYATTLENGTQLLSYRAPYLKLENVPLGMIGAYQGRNASLAMTAAIYLKQFYAFLIEEEHIVDGVKNAYLPGKFEIVQDDPTIVLDTAHNEDAINHTVITMKERFPKKPIHILFAAMKDKEIKKMLQQLTELSNDITITTFSHERAAQLTDYEKVEMENGDIEQLPKKKHWDYTNGGTEWLEAWLKTADKEKILLITGSNYFVDEMRRQLKNV